MPEHQPKKKSRLVMYLLIGIASIVLLFVYQLFAPNPPIIVSPQTTYITSPIGPDGLPDFERYLLDLNREGVTPENNAAVLVWQATWPGDLDPKDYAAMAKELGMSSIPSGKNSLKYRQGIFVHRIAEMLAKREGIPARDAFDDEFVYLRKEQAEGLVDLAVRRPWSSELLPPMAKWLTNNQKPLDLLVKASQRPRYRSPSPTFLNGEKNSLDSCLLPAAQGMRGAAKCLAIRAMHSLDNGDVEAVWRDALACHRLARLQAQEFCLVDQMVAIEMNNIACRATQQIVHHKNLSAELAQQILEELNQLEPWDNCAAVVDGAERVILLDIIIHKYLYGLAYEQQYGVSNSDPVSGYFLHALCIDWNVALTDANTYQDEVVEILNLPTYHQRIDAAELFAQKMIRLQKSNGSVEDNRWPLIFDYRSRSEYASNEFNTTHTTQIRQIIRYESQANTILELTRTAAALAVYRAEHGDYPEQLKALVPDVLPKLPVSAFGDNPLRYKRTDDGYLLYSFGEYGFDDQGFNEESKEKLSELPKKIRSGADDLAIRFPTPPIKLPAIEKPANEK